MEMVSLKNVKKFNGVRKIETNMNSVVRKGKNINRIQTAENVNNGTYYALPTIVQLNIGNSGVAMVELTPRITRMIPEGNSKYICIIEEQTLGAFATSFDNLRKGKFEKVVEKELQRYFNNNNEIRNDYETELKNKDEQIRIKDFQLNKVLSEKQDYQYKLNEEWNAHENTKDELCYTQDKLNNALVVIKEKDNEIAILNEKIDGLNQSLFNIKTEKITYTDNGLEQFLHMAETLANAKVNHDSFKAIMKEQFENLFLNQD